MSAWWQQIAAYWQSGGLLLLPIAGVSFGIWGFFLRSRDLLARTLREGLRVEDALSRGILGKTSSSLLAGLSRMGGGVAVMNLLAVQDVQLGSLPREAFAARESESLNLLRRDLIILTALTAVAPLLGLLGTVTGMIQTFDAVSTVGGQTGVCVADGISQALITTQFGLVVALPGLFGMAYLQRMLRDTQVLMGGCRVYALQALEHGLERR
jgi:biopolymer transport protein ExbB